MPRYFLHIREHHEFIEDPDGADYPDLDAARAEAVHGARDILVEKLRRGDPLDGAAIEITDENGKVVETVPFRTVMNIPG